jgi:hypothetical protein
LAVGLDERRDSQYYESLGNLSLQDKDETIRHFSFYGWGSYDEESTEERACFGDAIALSLWLCPP